MESSVTKAQNTFANTQRKSFGEPYAPTSKAEKIRVMNNGGVTVVFEGFGNPLRAINVRAGVTDEE